MPFSLYRTVSGQRVKQTISISEAFSSRPRSYRRNPRKDTKDAATQYSPPSYPAAKAAAPPVPAANEKTDEPKPTFTEAETKQLKELKAENKTWKQIAEIMKRDVEELKAYFKEVKDDNNIPPATGGGGDAAAAATEPKKDGGSTNKANEGGKKGKGGKKEMTEEQKKQAEEKKVAGLARQAELKKQKEGGAAAGPSKTTTLAPKATGSTSTPAAKPGDSKKTSEQEKKEARIKDLAPKVDGYYNKYLMVASRYFDETGTRISEAEVRKIIG